MSKYEEEVLRIARMWYQTHGLHHENELWQAVGQMCEREAVEQKRAADLSNGGNVLPTKKSNRKGIAPAKSG